MDDGDRIALHELAARYGDLVDDEDVDALDQVFTEDATFEVNGRVLDGLAAIRRFIAEDARRPLSHHITNVWVEHDGSEAVLHSRIISIRPTGVTTGRYHDVVVKGPDGWRVLRRTFRSDAV